MSLNGASIEYPNIFLSRNKKNNCKSLSLIVQKNSVLIQHGNTIVDQTI